MSIIRVLCDGIYLYKMIFSQDSELNILCSVYYHNKILIKDLSLFSSELFNKCLIRGIVHDYDFAMYIYNKYVSNLTFEVKTFIICRMIMSNDIREKLIRKYKPFYIWYPELPSISTLETLSNMSDFNIDLSIPYILLDKKYDFTDKLSYYNFAKLLHRDDLLQYFDSDLENDNVSPYFYLPNIKYDDKSFIDEFDFETSIFYKAKIIYDVNKYSVLQEFLGKYYKLDLNNFNYKEYMKGNI